MEIIKDTQTQYVNRLVKKYGKRIEITEGCPKSRFGNRRKEKKLNGFFAVKGIRQYGIRGGSTNYEVDLDFDGSLYCIRRGIWYDSISLDSRISKIRAYKLIRDNITEDLSSYLHIFGIVDDFYPYLKIKKVKWLKKT